MMLHTAKQFRTHRQLTRLDRQAGGLTIFSAVILLSLLTLMLVYSSRTQQSEQRISSNEYRQKLAFHAAEAGAEQALEYLLANSARILSANIALPLTNFNFFNGSPAVPLTTRTTFPPTGTAEIVPNPNAGGVGVPVSVWANTSCSTGDPLLASGNWATCEYHEWYESDEIPPDLACGSPSCSCSQSEAISYTTGQADMIGIDLFEDDNFPCDLFDFFFGVPRSEYQLMKSSARIIEDCDGLGPDSHGIYWVSGTECRLDGTNVVGSPQFPVMLISAAQSTVFTGGNHIYGIVFVTDVEYPGATWGASGTNIVYGSMIIDADLDAFLGTFKIIYNESVSLRAAGTDGIGTLSGGWRDFGLPEFSWEE